MSNLPAWLVVDGNYSRKMAELSDPERLFMQNKDRATCLLLTEDPEACYSYDDYALCSLDGVYYVFNTSGCSCPSPDETWRLEAHGTKTEIQDWINTFPGYSGFRFAMTEPLYTYVRGQGWVINPPETCTMRCGTVVRLEYRMPEYGEPWLRSAGWLKAVGIDRVQQYEPIYGRFKDCLIGDWHSYEQLFTERSAYPPDGPHGTMTIVKL